MKSVDLGRLPGALRKRLAAARAVARERGVRLFLVGGVVRDLLLGRKVEDLDLVVEGDGPDFARRLAARLRGTSREHGRFLTASVNLPGGGRLDLATARRETYDHPGALPRVAPASIEEDLARRDFTVNAMAVELAPARRPKLLDPSGGREDLRRRTLRLLHPRSILDDPTRAFRAVRYANRLGFYISRDAVVAIRAARKAGAFDQVSGDRIRRELELIFAEPGPDGAARRLAALDLHRALGLRSADLPRALKRLACAGRLARAWPEASGLPLYLLAWASNRPAAEFLALANRLSLTGEAGRALRLWPATRRRLAPLRLARRRSTIRRRIEGLCAWETAALAARLPPPAAARVFAAARWPVRLAIGGRDLVAAGVPPGPSIGAALEATRAAREDGKLSAGGELDFAVRRARRGTKPK